MFEFQMFNVYERLMGSRPELETGLFGKSAKILQFAGKSKVQEVKQLPAFLDRDENGGIEEDEVVQACDGKSILHSS